MKLPNAERVLIPREKIGQYDRAVGGQTNQPLLTRQALHAHRLTLTHPVTANPMAFEAPLFQHWPDVRQIVDCVRRPGMDECAGKPAGDGKPANRGNRRMNEAHGKRHESEKAGVLEYH